MSSVSDACRTVSSTTDTPAPWPTCSLMLTVADSRRTPPRKRTGSSGFARAAATALALATTEAAWAVRSCVLRPASTHALKSVFAAMAAARVAHVLL
eukprot:2738493-Prymnesium_polylepis.1